MSAAYGSFENTAGKGETARNEQFLLFLQGFPPYLRTLSNSKLLSANSLVWKSLKFVVWEGVKALWPKDNDFCLSVRV